MKYLFLGGNGNISWYVVNEALKHGHDVWTLNRHQSYRTRRDTLPAVHQVYADIHNLSLDVLNLLRREEFDVVFDFICFNDFDAQERCRIFGGYIKEYVFISSESVYKRSCYNLPFKEDCEQYNPMDVDSYIAGKILAEQSFIKYYENSQFPVTIIRPTLTYDTIIPLCIGHNCFTASKKLIDGRPVLIGGDGENLLSITHSKDFANALINLVESCSIAGEDFHIASEVLITWNEASKCLFDALEIENYRAVHIPYKEALKINDFHSPVLMQQRLWHNIYNLSKLKKYVPEWKAEIRYAQGIKETINWMHADTVRMRIVEKYSTALDRLYDKYDGRE